MHGRTGKKLKEAAQGWAAPPVVSTTTISDMEKFGATAKQIKSMSETKPILIMPMNWLVAVWFTEIYELLRWRSDGMCLGFDVLQVQSEAQMSLRNYTSQQIKDLRLMGKLAARTINKVNE